MDKVTPFNGFILVKFEENKDNVSGSIFLPNQKEIKTATVISVSEDCKQKIAVNDTVKVMTDFDKVPFDEENRLFFIKETSIIAKIN